MSVIGSVADILIRVRKLIPKRWFQWGALYRDAIIGGLSVPAAWNYTLIGYARAQTRLASAYGIWLDIIAYDFLGRTLLRNGAADDTFRALIQATILQERVTRAGMIGVLTKLTGNAPWIFEPWNTYDTGAYSGPAFISGSPKYGSMGYGVGRGGYGNMGLPCQAFIKVTRGGPSGIPKVAGYGSPNAGYGVGQVEYVGGYSELSGVTDTMIYQAINITKPTGSACWVAIN
jgi:hypothetical protein